MAIFLLSKNKKGLDMKKKFQISEKDYYREGEDARIPIAFQSHIQFLKSMAISLNKRPFQENLDIILAFNIWGKKREPGMTVFVGIQVGDEENCFWGGFLDHTFLDLLEDQDDKHKQIVSREIARLVKIALSRARAENEDRIATAEAKRSCLERWDRTYSKILLDT